MFLSASSSACAGGGGGAGGACMCSSDTDTHVPDVGAGCVVVVELAEAAGLRGILCDIHNI